MREGDKSGRGARLGTSEMAAKYSAMANMGGEME